MICLPRSNSTLFCYAFLFGRTPAAFVSGSGADPLVRAGRPRPAKAGQGAGRGPGGPPHYVAQTPVMLPAQPVDGTVETRSGRPPMVSTVIFLAIPILLPAA